jgi:hypothetical protein
MLERLDGLPGVEARTVYDGREHITPRVELRFAPASGIDAHALVLAMEQNDTRIYLFEPNGPSSVPNSVIINTQTMQPGDEKIIAEVLRPAIRQRLTGG